MSAIKNGDKRIILINGEPIAALRRVPKHREIRSNIHVEGDCKPIGISKNDLEICNAIKDLLLDEGLFLLELI